MPTGHQFKTGRKQEYDPKPPTPPSRGQQRKANSYKVPICAVLLLTLGGGVGLLLSLSNASTRSSTCQRSPDCSSTVQDECLVLNPCTQEQPSRRLFINDIYSTLQENGLDATNLSKWNTDLTAFWFSEDSFIAKSFYDGVNDACKPNLTQNQDLQECEGYFFEVANADTGNVFDIVNNKGVSIIDRINFRIYNSSATSVWEDPEDYPDMFAGKCVDEFEQKKSTILRWIEEHFPGCGYRYSNKSLPEGSALSKICHEENVTYDDTLEYDRMLCNALLYPNEENRIHDVLNMYIRTSSDENNVAYYTNGCEVGYGKVMSAQSIKSINLIFAVQLFNRFVLGSDEPFQMFLNYRPVPTVDLLLTRIGDLPCQPITGERPGDVSEIEERNFTDPGSGTQTDGDGSLDDPGSGNQTNGDGSLDDPGSGSQE